MVVVIEVIFKVIFFSRDGTGKDRQAAGRNKKCSE